MDRPNPPSEPFPTTMIRQQSYWMNHTGMALNHIAVYLEEGEVADGPSLNPPEGLFATPICPVLMMILD